MLSGFQATCAASDPWWLELCGKRRPDAFLALRHGTAAAWGAGACSAEVAETLRHVVELRCTQGAFAALRLDGTVCTWGHSLDGADKSRVRGELQQVRALYATSRAFCALRSDGQVVAWGGPQLANYGGDATRVQEQLRDVVSVRASGSAFAAMRSSEHYGCVLASRF